MVNPLAASLIIIVVLGLLNFASIEIFPIVWVDEVMFTDPAVNLALDGKFVSTAWPTQSDKLVWASNAPLYSLLLGGWIKLFGFTIASVRSMNIVFASAAIILFVDALRQARIVTSPLLLSAFVLALLLDYGLVLNYRAGRYDGVGILLVAIAAWSAIRPGLIYLAIFSLACVAIPAAGVHVAVGAALALIILLVVFGAPALRMTITGLTSLAAGTGLLLAVFHYYGVLGVFLDAAKWLRSIVSGSAPKDPSFWLIVMAATVQMVRLRYLSWWDDRRLLFLAVLGLLLPVSLHTLGRFPTYYTWMSVLPLCALIFALFELEFRRVGLWKGIVVWGLMGLACAAGLPLQIGSGIFWSKSRSYAEVKNIVRNLKPTDVVVCDPAAYYAVRPVAAKTYTVAYLAAERWMSKQERDAVSVLVIPPDQFDFISKLIGGNWRPEERTPGARAVLPLFRKNFGDKLIEVYDLRAYTRI